MSTHNMFLLRNKDISIFSMKKAPYLLLWIPTLIGSYANTDKVGIECDKLLDIIHRPG